MKPNRRDPTRPPKDDLPSTPADPIGSGSKSDPSSANIPKSRPQPLDEEAAVEGFRRICPRPPTEEEIQNFLELARFWHNYANPDTESDLKQAEGGLLIEDPTDTEARARPWLWPGYIKGGDLTLFVGDSGHGKSTITTDIGRRLVTWPKFWPWPPSQLTPGARCVIYLSREEDRRTEFAPRVKAMAGEESEIALESLIRVQRVQDEKSIRGIELPDDIPRLRKMIRERQALALFIDPLNSYFRSDADLFKEKSVRSVLEPLLDLAHETGAAIVPLVHFGKGEEGKEALGKILNSVAYRAVPRAILGVSVLPEDRDKPDDEKRRIFGMLLSNIGPLGPALIFGIDRMGAIHWQGSTYRSVKAAVEGRVEKEDSREIQGRAAIERILPPGGRIPSKDLNIALTAHGIEPNGGTASRIRTALGLVAARDPDTKEWMTSRPMDHPL